MARIRLPEDEGGRGRLSQEENDPELLTAALGDVARSKGMSELAKAAGLGRQNLYKALSPNGNPEFATVAKVLKALGLKLIIAA